MVSTVVINTLIVLKAVPKVGYWRLINKPHRRLFLLLVFYMRAVPRVTKTYQVYPLTIFYGLMHIDIQTSQNTVLFFVFYIIFIPRDTNHLWVNPWKILVVCCRFIYKPHIRLLFLLVFYIRVGPRGTKAQWVNLWTIFGMLLDIDI